MYFPKIEFSTAPENGDAIALGWSQAEASAKPAATKETKTAAPTSPSSPTYRGKRTKEIDALVERLKQSTHFGGKKNEVSLLRYFAHGTFPNVLLVGTGLAKKWTPEMARQTGAALSLAQRRDKLKRVVVATESFFADGKSDMADFVQAFCEGYWLAGHDYSELKKKEGEPFRPEGIVLAGLKGKEIEKVVFKARVLAESVSFARLLGDRPGNYMTPTLLATAAQTMAKEVGLRCRVLDKAAIEAEKMGLLLGVSKGSHEEPRFFVLDYQGGKKGDKPVALVGKGVTFDSGGISLKPANQMEDMKYDMMGAASVIAICRAVAALKLPINVMGIVAATENMPGGSAQKPGDVARSMNGRTVEIVNTDAEGRLILADALEYAQRYEPQAIIDFATLTGAVVVALGTVCTGIMGTHKGLIQRIKDSAEATGERVWELPLYEEYEDDLKSSYADIRNSGSRDAGSSKGGVFLKHFIDPKFPWVHCDIAGGAYHRKDVNYHPFKYASGVMVRATVDLLENWKPLK